MASKIGDTTQYRKAKQCKPMQHKTAKKRITPHYTTLRKDKQTDRQKDRQGGVKSSVPQPVEGQLAVRQCFPQPFPRLGVSADSRQQTTDSREERRQQTQDIRQQTAISSTTASKMAAHNWAVLLLTLPPAWGQRRQQTANSREDSRQQTAGKRQD